MHVLNCTRVHTTVHGAACGGRLLHDCAGQRHCSAAKPLGQQCPDVPNHAIEEGPGSAFCLFRSADAGCFGGHAQARRHPPRCEASQLCHVSTVVQQPGLR